jgi:hypothetical protein
MEQVDLPILKNNHDRSYTESDFDGSHAAPLLIIGNYTLKHLTARQDHLAKNFANAVQGELSDITTPGVVDFVSNSLISRMHQREGLNGLAFMRRLNYLPHPWEVPNRSIGYVLRACGVVPLGKGDIDQNHTATLAYGMPSGELANLTVINEFRRDEEAPMWDGVSELIGRDAAPHPDDMRAFTVLGFDRDILTNQHVGAVRIGMKRDIGMASGNTEVKSRTTAIINTRPSSGFDQDIVAQLREATYEKKDLVDIPDFHRAIRWLITSELKPGKVLARNETVYEINQTAAHRIAQKRAWRSAE